MDEWYYHYEREQEARQRAADAVATRTAYEAALADLSRAPEEVPRTCALVGAGKAEPLWVELARILFLALALFGGFFSAVSVSSVLRGAPQVVSIIGALVVLTAVYLLLIPLSVWLLGRLDRAGRRDALVHAGVATVLACVHALEAPGAERAEHFQGVDDLYRRAEPLVLRAHRTRGTIGGSSPRRTAARQHAERVAGALRRDLCRMDAEPQDALRDLAGKLVVVCERYAEGRIGRLLPEADLADVEPVTLTRRALRESALMAVVIAAAFCGALGAWLGGQAAGLPDGFLPWTASFGMLLGGTLAGGWQRAARLAELLPGL
ncbi:hypothetical protein SUDANB106_00295 [Streptomyces sp. enrichment culture]|uniref:hypothetical protein n=1 Tax=Streptomyces sp. enrichment culture TaxID=1795815 RepID=UPI003F544CB6